MKVKAEVTQLRRRSLLLFVFLGQIVSQRSARAHQVTLEVGAVAPSFAAPAAYPKAYRGVGFEAGLSYVLSDWSSSLRASYLSQGTGTLTMLTFQSYLLGKPQSSGQRSVDGADELPKDQPVLVQSSYWGLNVFGGLASYSTSRINPDQSKAIGSGYGIILGCGVEYPLVLGLFGYLKASLLETVGGPTNMLTTQGGLGLPFAF